MSLRILPSHKQTVTPPRAKLSPVRFFQMKPHSFPLDFILYLGARRLLRALFAQFPQIIGVIGYCNRAFSTAISSKYVRIVHFEATASFVLIQGHTGQV